MKKTVLIAVFLFSFLEYALSQPGDSVKTDFQVSGAVNLTTKGISIIPSYTLGKPAMIFSMNIGGRLSFEPEFRYSIAGKPWMFLLWGRYDLVDAERLTMRIGVNPSNVFKELSEVSTDTVTDALVVQRSLTTEFYPSYLLTDHIRIGTYYMYVRGFVTFASRNKHYLAVRACLLDLRLSKKCYATISPQAFYLRVDQDDGYFVSSSLSLHRKDFPISLHALANKKIRSSIPGTKDFLWNMTLRYSFARKF